MGNPSDQHGYYYLSRLVALLGDGKFPRGVRCRTGSGVGPIYMLFNMQIMTHTWWCPGQGIPYTRKAVLMCTLALNGIEELFPQPRTIDHPTPHTESSLHIPCYGSALAALLYAALGVHFLSLLVFASSTPFRLFSESTRTFPRCHNGRLYLKTLISDNSALSTRLYCFIYYVVEYVFFESIRATVY